MCSSHTRKQSRKLINSDLTNLVQMLQVYISTEQTNKKETKTLRALKYIFDILTPSIQGSISNQMHTVSVAWHCASISDRHVVLPMLFVRPHYQQRKTKRERNYMMTQTTECCVFGR